MEKRAVVPLVLGGAGVALAVAIVVLLVKVRAGAPAPEVSPGEVARTAARAPAPSAPPSRPAASPPAVPAAEPPPAGAGEAGIGGSAGSGGEADQGGVSGKMTEANRLYDRGDYEAARDLSDEVLKAEPQNVKMLRIGASSSCILGDASGARAYYDKLPERDQEQIARRCRRYGVEF